MNTHNDLADKHRCSRACHFCDNSPALVNSNGNRVSLLINGPHWTGSKYERVDYCTGCAGSIAKAPRRPRQPRQKQYPATDWNMLMLFTEATTGRRAHRR